MNLHKLSGCITILVTSILAQQSLAYTTIKCGGVPAKWAENNYTVHASSVGFPVGPWRDALSFVIRHWNGNPSNLRYDVLWDDTSVDTRSNENEVWWEADNDSNIGSAPAITYLWFNASCNLKEVDIVFNHSGNYHYTTDKASLWPYGGAYRPFQTTAMHEFGHAGGLAHTANTYSIMGIDWTHIHANGATATAYSGEDANNGMVAIYGLWSGGSEDFGVAHWRHTGNIGEYSTHGRTRLLDTSLVELPKVIGTAEPVYRVDKGQTVRFEMTYENMGKTSPLSAPIRYYISTDDTISTADRPLGEGGVITLYRGFVDTTSDTFLVIPIDLVSGQTYWLGAIIDYKNVIPERNEANNATYIGIRVN